MRSRSLLVRAGRLRRHFSEQAKKVLARLPSNRVQRYVASFGHNLCRLNNIGRLIALATIPAGSQIGGIGLEQDALRRKALRNRAKLIRFFEGHDPSERYEETERDRPPREIAAVREAVQHGRESAPPRFLLQYACHILVRLARVDDERQTGRPRCRYMVAQTLFPRAAQEQGLRNHITAPRATRLLLVMDS